MFLPTQQGVQGSPGEIIGTAGIDNGANPKAVRGLTPHAHLPGSASLVLGAISVLDQSRFSEKQVPVLRVSRDPSREQGR